MDKSARQELLPTSGPELKLNPNEWIVRGMLAGHRVIHFFVVPDNSPLLSEGEIVAIHEDAVIISASVPYRPLSYNPDTTSQSYIINKFVAEEERKHALETGGSVRIPQPYELRKARPEEPEVIGA